MLVKLGVWPVQVFTFALGCALIHANRDRPGATERILSWTAALLATAFMVALSLTLMPDGAGYADEITLYDALAQSMAPAGPAP